jgi:Acetyltransferase (GNAT) family.
VLTLRPTSPGDGHALAELLAVVWAGQENGAAYHGGGRRPGVVAVCAGKLVGYGQLWHSRLHPTYAYAGVHVHPQWRGQGIGGELWNAVTKDVEQPLKAKTYATQSAAVRFLQRRGLRVSVETLEPMLWPADLEDVTPWVRAAEQLGFVLRPMTELSDELRTQLLPLHREVYAHAHLHDPACPEVMDEDDFLGDDLCPAWLYVAERGGELAGVSSVRRTAEPETGELAWFGVPQRWAAAGAPLTLALTALAFQAAGRGGVQSLSAELDSADSNAVHLGGVLLWVPGPRWLTLTGT